MLSPFSEHHVLKSYWKRAWKIPCNQTQRSDQPSCCSMHYLSR